MEKHYVLTAQEIGDALVMWIGFEKEHVMMFPFKIKNSSHQFPLEVALTLEAIPKGSLVSEYPHLMVSKVVQERPTLPSPTDAYVELVNQAIEARKVDGKVIVANLEQIESLLAYVGRMFARGVMP